MCSPLTILLQRMRISAPCALLARLPKLGPQLPNVSEQIEELCCSRVLEYLAGALCVCSTASSVWLWKHSATYRYRDIPTGTDITSTYTELG